MYSLMVGVSESYFGAMAVELGHRDTALALLLTVPMLFGSTLQLLAGPLTALLGARKRLVVIGATLQTLSMLGMYFIARTACARSCRCWPPRACTSCARCWSGRRGVRGWRR